MQAKTYLEKVLKNEGIIKNKLIEREKWMTMASGTSVSLNTDKVSGSPDQQKMASRVIEAVTIDEEIDRLKAEIKDVISTIEMLPEKHYNVAHKVYVQGKSFKEIALEDGKSYSTISDRHSAMLKKVQRIIDKKDRG